MSIVDNLFDSISLIAKDIISKADFDKTYLCTITAVEELEDGTYKYTIKYEEGNRIFTIADAIKYRENTQVWINVPMGKWENSNLTISGKYNKDESKAISVISYEDSFIPVVTLTAGIGQVISIDNLKYNLTTPMDGFGLKADINTKSNEEVFNYGLNIYLAYLAKPTKTEFVANKTHYYIIEEEKLKLCESTTEFSLDTQYYTVEVLEWTDKDLFGDPYHLSVPFPYSKLFTGNDYNKIKYLLFKSKNNNALYRNLTFSFGYLKDNFKDGEKLYLYEKDGQDNYNGLNILNIRFLYFHKDENGNIVCYDTELPSKYEDEDKKVKKEYSINWYRYKIGSTLELDNDLRSGCYYGRISTEKELELNNTEKTITVNNNSSYTEVLPYSKLSKESIKAIIYYTQTETIETETITKKVKSCEDTKSFLNANFIQSTIYDSANETINITFPDHPEYENLIIAYGRDNVLMENNFPIKLKATATESSTKLEDIVCTWKVPAKSTILNPLFTDVDVSTDTREAVFINRYCGNSKIISDLVLIPTLDGWYRHIKADEEIEYSKELASTCKIAAAARGEAVEYKLENGYYLVRGLGLTEITVTLTRNYNFSTLNNRIFCEATDDLGNSINGSLLITIGTKGSTGTGFGFNAYLEDTEAIYLDDGGHMKDTYINIVLTDSDGNNINGNIPIDSSTESPKPNITYKWLNFPEDLTHAIDAVPDYDTTNYAYKIRLSSASNLSATIQYNVLKITLKNWLNDNNTVVNLTTYVLIPVFKKGYSYEGASRIVYGMMGSEISRSTKLYLLFNNGNLVNGFAVNLLTNATSLIKFNKDQNLLITPVTFSNDLYQSSAIVEFFNGGIVGYIPLLIILDAYESAIINNWDGSNVKIGDNYILSPLIGGGSKDNNNNFTGVLMGDVSINDNEITIPAGVSPIGLFGFNKGGRTFSIDAETGDVYLKGLIEATSGVIGGCEIKDGVLKVPAANISGKLTATLIDASSLHVNAANIDGIIAQEIKVTKGFIGGWTIDGNRITNVCKVGNTNYRLALCSNTDESGYAIYVTTNNSSSGVNFSLDWAGNIYARGVINATSGTFKDLEVKYSDASKNYKLINSNGEVQLGTWVITENGSLRTQYKTADDKINYIVAANSYGIGFTIKDSTHPIVSRLYNWAEIYDKLLR